MIAALNQWCMGRKADELFDLRLLVDGADWEPTEPSFSCTAGCFSLSPHPARRNSGLDFLQQNLIKPAWEWDGRAVVGRESRSWTQLLTFLLEHYGSKGYQCRANHSNVCKLCRFHFQVQGSCFIQSWECKRVLKLTGMWFIAQHNTKATWL